MAWFEKLAVFVATLGVSQAALAEEGARPTDCAARPETGANPEHRAYARWSLGSGCSFLEVPLTLRAGLQTASAVPVDRYGNSYGTDLALAPDIRIGARASSALELAPVQLFGEYEQDVLTGATSSHSELAGTGYPGGEGLHIEPRKAYVRGSIGRALHLSTGLDTSHWGLGLVANDGDHDWQPGSAAFVYPRGGDRVFRWSAATGPHGDLGFAAMIGADRVYRDDVLLDGDRARQFFAAVLVGRGKPHGFGMYVVRRNQRDAANRPTDVWVLDATAKTTLTLDAGRLTLEAESALVMGTTELGQNVENTSYDVRQVGAALRAAFDAGKVGAVLDALYASGDQNPYDDQQNAFKADPNYEMGLVLFRYALAAQTARGAATAGDPTLVGIPAANVERIPTRGSATNTLAVFPRFFVRPLEGLEGYGGPLVAFTPVPSVDPFNTQLAGGEARNALNGKPGSYLGTELDLGVRYRFANAPGAGAVTVGAEGGMLLAGSALQDASGASMKSLYLVRGLARVAF
jgi:hypothetical protein